MRADFNLSRPKDANSCWKKLKINKIEVRVSREDYISKHKLSVYKCYRQADRQTCDSHLPRREGREVQMSSGMRQSTACLFLTSRGKKLIKTNNFSTSIISSNSLLEENQK